MIEEWKLIEDTCYMVSNHGRIKHVNRTKPLKPFVIDGYHLVKIHGKNKRIHRLVAEAFLINDGKSQVNHLDGNKAHNHVENLEWVDQPENIKHTYITGLRKSKRIKITPRLITNINNDYAEHSIRYCCKKYKLSHSTIKRYLKTGN